ncbi:aldo/keto reductase [Planosporangium thailandense]|uniref:Aldo/keto reductase n=1 Tax=Planosporangium thailandense TaxID=765197 RepID=A0ABX0Y3J9_9ACTN|nr:aldo/keto reductase family protein [Planosporangium thailandense]NJC72961.1 aldo/keto reductase [Planosporangium thailandense]
MEYVRLGASGLKVSRVVYGNWLTHGPHTDRADAFACVRAARDLGISTFDTADAYANTEAESVLGEALQHERRESLEILTKVYNPIGPRGHNDSGLSRKHIMEGINGSLRRLRTDYVDVYQAHRFDTETPLEETMRAMADVVRQGKALYIGVSEWTADQLRRGADLARQLGIQLVSNQPQYSMLWRVIEQEVVPTCEQLGISQIVWSPLAQGVLTGKYLPDARPPGGSRGAGAAESGEPLLNRFMQPEVLRRVQRLRPVADALGLSLAQLALAWALKNRNVAAAIVGASRPEQLKESVAGWKANIPPDAMARIDEILADVVERRPEMTAAMAPKRRPT